jgi:hypothetical protein
MVGDSIERKKTPTSVTSSFDSIGGTDDLFALMGMKKFSILDVSDNSTDGAQQTSAAVNAQVSCHATADGGAVRVTLRLLLSS